MSGFPWDVLGIGETSDKGEVRRAYSARLKELDLDQQIAEYAQLRQARDHALWLAANPPQEDDDFGLGSLDDDDFGDFDDAPAPTTYDGDDDFEWEIREGELADDGYGGGLSLGTRPGELDPFHARREEPELPDGWAELAALVFPGGMQSNEPFTPQEADEADAALDRLIAWAEEGGLERETTLDHNLAEMLAGGWPRSAPVVDKANTAFHWLGEAGGLDERPALQFLNARTQGMRFHDAVEQDGHPLHAAWRELQQPGKVSVLGRIKGSRSDIERLLQTIRGRFPELESLLDAQRVQSWETPASDIVSWAVQRLFIVFLLVQVVRLVFFSDPAPMDEQLADRFATTQMEQLHEGSAEVFDATFWWVKGKDEAFAEQYEAYIREAPEGEAGEFARTITRNRMLFARFKADFDALVSIQSVRLSWLDAAKDDRELCGVVLDGSFRNGGPELAGDQAEAEQLLSRQLLEKGLLSGYETQGATSTTIPPWLMDKGMAETGLTYERFDEALQDPKHEERCAVQAALLRGLLEDPARAPLETLRGL